MSSKSEDKTVRQPCKENSKDPQPIKEKLQGNQSRMHEYRDGTEQ